MPKNPLVPKPIVDKNGKATTANVKVDGKPAPTARVTNLVPLTTERATALETSPHRIFDESIGLVIGEDEQNGRSLENHQLFRFTDENPYFGLHGEDWNIDIDGVVPDIQSEYLEGGPGAKLVQDAIKHIPVREDSRFFVGDPQAIGLKKNGFASYELNGGEGYTWVSGIVSPENNEAVKAHIALPIELTGLGKPWLVRESANWTPTYEEYVIEIAAGEDITIGDGMQQLADRAESIVNDFDLEAGNH